MRVTGPNEEVAVGPLELWTVTGPTVGQAVANTVRAERDGWDGITFGDSQNIVGDVWVEMALSAAATSTLRLATWVTNPVTRHPAVTASAAATLQAESGGRVELSIGRGDSALAHLGLAPAPVAVLAEHVERLQGYLPRRRRALRRTGRRARVASARRTPWDWPTRRRPAASVGSPPTCPRCPSWSAPAGRW